MTKQGEQQTNKATLGIATLVISLAACSDTNFKDKPHEPSRKQSQSLAGEDKQELANSKNKAKDSSKKNQKEESKADSIKPLLTSGDKKPCVENPPQGKPTKRKDDDSSSGAGTKPLPPTGARSDCVQGTTERPVQKDDSSSE